MARANHHPAPATADLSDLLGAVGRRLQGPTARGAWSDLDGDERAALVAEAIEHADDLWFWRLRLLEGTTGLLDEVDHALRALADEGDTA